MSRVEIVHGDCLGVFRSKPDGFLDSVVTDPPAAIGFMGKSWDGDRGGRSSWVAWLAARLAELRRCTRPGGYMLCWALPRTSHWTGLAIEDAGWVIRDRVSHLFGTGFPKSHACLKPACEDWWLAWNPAAKVTPLNIDGCRIEAVGGLTSGGNNVGSSPLHMNRAAGVAENRIRSEEHPLGRWPANVTHDGSDEVMEAFAAFGESSSKAAARGGTCPGPMGWGTPRADGDIVKGHTDSGTAARFFFCAKASRSDRGTANTHPTVKSVDLCRWLCRLVTPPGGLVGDGFTGSGSVAVAAMREGFRFFGAEKEEGYVSIALSRAASEVASAPLLHAFPEPAGPPPSPPLVPARPPLFAAFGE